MSEIRYNPLDGEPVRYLAGFPLPSIESLGHQEGYVPFSDDQKDETTFEGPYNILGKRTQAALYVRIPAPDGLDRSVCDRLALLGDGTALYVASNGEVLIDEEGTESALETEKNHEKAYYDIHTTALLLDYGRWERGMGVRLVAENAMAAAIVPYWASDPFEMLIIPTKRTIGAFDQMQDAEEDAFIGLYQEAVRSLDRLCNGKADYLCCLHQSHAAGHMLHVHLVPLTKKRMQFSSDYAILCMRSCTLKPEESAHMLREASHG